MIQDSVKVVTDTVDMVNQIGMGSSQLFMLVATLLASGLMGLSKKHIIPMDKKIVEYIKPIQPIIVSALGVGIGYLGAYFTSLVPADANLVAGAPLAGLLVVTIRELIVRLRKKS